MTTQTKKTEPKKKVKRPNRFKVTNAHAVKAMRNSEGVSKTFAKNAINHGCTSADDYRTLRNKR